MCDKKELVKYVSALVISDAHLTKPIKNGNSRLELYQINKHQDFISQVESVLKNLTNISITERILKSETQNNQLKLTTGKLPFYTKIRKRFYINGKKVVDPHALTLLDAEFLAIWFMCDGVYYYQRSNKSHQLSLCTDYFSYGDNLLLQRKLYEKLDLNFNIHKRHDTYRLYLPVKEYYKFVELVEPYICDSFRYKMPNIETCM